MKADQKCISDMDVQQALYRILDSIKQLPSPPEVCLAVTRAAQDEGTTLSDLQALVENDIALSGRLMQVANSAFFGVREPVTSVRRAISLLGFGTVRSLALGFFFNEEFGKLRIPGLPYPDLPRYAMASSVLAESIARHVAPELAAEAGCVGLLHESGVIVMAMAFGGQYRRMLAVASGGQSALQQAEMNAFGVNHVTAGKLLLTGWRLSDAFVEAVANHHTDDFNGSNDATATTFWRIIRLASCGALLFFGEASRVDLEAAALAKSYFGWERPKFGTILRNAATMYEQRTTVMGLGPVSIATDVEAVMQTAVLLGAA